MRMTSQDHDKAAGTALSRAKELPPLCVCVTEGRRHFGNIGKTAFYAALKKHKIGIVRLGNRSLIPWTELERLLRECSQAGNSARDRAQALAARSVQSRKSTALKSEFEKARLG